MGALDRVLRMSVEADIAALAQSNIIINGFMEVSQENGTSLLTAANPGPYVTDQFQAYAVGPTVTAQKVSAPFPSFPGIRSGVRLAVTTAKAALAAGDLIQILHRIEGARLAPLRFGAASARNASVGFIARSNVAGTFTVALRNGASNRSHVKNFTLAANVDTFVPITFPGDTGGAWATDNTLGGLLSVSFAAGTTFQTGEGAWRDGNFIASGSTTNLGAAVNNEVIISGLVMLPGNQLPPKESWSLLQRSEPDELALCQRYWRMIPRIDMYRLSSAETNKAGTMLLNPPMRTAPSTAIGSNQQAGNPNLTVDATYVRAAATDAVATLSSAVLNITLNARL